MVQFIWTFKLTKTEAEKYETRGAFQKGSRQAYKAAWKKGWLDEICAHMHRVYRPDGYWTKEKAHKEALKYKRRVDFQKNSKPAWSVAQNKGWLDEICSHMVREGNRVRRGVYEYWFADGSVYVGLTYSITVRSQVHENNAHNSEVRERMNRGIPFVRIDPNEYISEDLAAVKEINRIAQLGTQGFIVLNKHKGGGLGGNRERLTKEDIQNLALKYEVRAHFDKGEPGAYKQAAQQGWLDEVCAHMVDGRVRRTIWTKEACVEKAKEYETRTRFQKGCPAAYDAANRNGWLNDCYEHMGRSRTGQTRRKWSDPEKVISAARGCSNRTEFQRRFRSAWEAAKKFGCLEECYSHMVK